MDQQLLQHPKIVGRQDLPKILCSDSASRINVFTNGCFDLLHPGHVDLLAKARALGDKLIVGLNSDDSVQRLSKGPGRPFNPYPVRAFVLAHLESVDYVVQFDEDTPYELIQELQPQILVKGGDYQIEDVVGRDIVEAQGGRVEIIPFLPGCSTTDLAKKIIAAHGLH